MMKGKINRALRTSVGLLALFAVAAAVAAPGAPSLKPVPSEVSQAVIRGMRDRVRPQPALEALASELSRTADVLRRIEANPSAGAAISPEERMLLEGQRLRFATVRDEVERKVAGADGPDARSQGREERVRAWGRAASKFQQLARSLEDVSSARDGIDAGRAARKALDLIDRLNSPKTKETQSAWRPQQRVQEPRPSVQERRAADVPGFVATLEEQRSRMVAANGDFGPILAPTPAEATTCSYTPADLAPTPDVQLTQEILDLAKALEYDPRRIYQYVYEQIRFEPYWGAMKGAVGTLKSKAGGPADQASLTIALLRASNIPARYVRGTLFFFTGIDRAARWIGTETYPAAALMLSMGGYPTHVIDEPNQTFFMSHVWVEACVPYGNYRGSRADLSGHRWIPLDPSYKEVDAPTRVSFTVPAFDYASYMSARTNELPHEHYAKQIEAAAKAAAGNNIALEDVLGEGRLVKRRWDVLPTSLPYAVAQFNQWGNGNASAVTSALPPTHRYSLSVSVKQGASALTSTYTAKLADIAQSRLTIGFKGATATHETNLKSWRATGDALTPVCTINVLPSIRLDGVEQVAGTGTGVGLCATNIDVALKVQLPELDVLFPLPPGTPGEPMSTFNTSVRTIGAADHAAVIAYALQGSERVFTERYKRLGEVVQENSLPLDTLEKIDAVEGEFLSAAGLRYAYLFSERARYVGSLVGIAYQPGPHLGLTSSKSKVSYVFDEPLSVSLEGTLVDVEAAPLRAVRLAETNIASYFPGVKDFFRFVLYDGSAHEHYIWQETARIDAVSTVRGLQWAQEHGAEYAIQQFDSTNIGQWESVMDPALACYKPGTTASGCVNPPPALKPGDFIRIPRKKINYVAEGGTKAWNGIVYELNLGDRISMAISGNFNGGYGLFDVASFFDIYAPLPTVLPNFFSADLLALDQISGTPPFVDGFVLGNTVTAGDPVNMLTGNMYHVERDIALKGRGGFPIVFERSYNSRNPKDGPLGFGWTHTFNQYLRFYGVEGGQAKVSWTDGSGAERFFQTATHTGGNITPGASFQAQPGVFTAMTRNVDGSYQVRERSGLTLVFEAGVTGPASPPPLGSEPRARLIRIQDRNGNKLAISYAGLPNVTVTDDLSRVLTLKHDGNNRIYEITDWTGRRFGYEYDLSGNLVAFKNPLAVDGAQNPVTYSYYSGSQLNHAMQSYTLPRGNGMSFEYYLNGKVLRHTTTLGEATSFFYNDFRRESYTIDPRGNKRTFVFDKYGNSENVIDENGGQHFSTYDPDPGRPFNRLSSRDPMGYVTGYAYDADGNNTRVTNPSGATVEYSHFNQFGQPGKVKDPRGNYSILKYDPKGNLTESIVLKQGIGATADPASYIPGPADVLAWTKTSYDAFGNVVGVQRIKDFVAQTGPTVTYTLDQPSLNVLSVRRCGDKGAGVQECDDSPLMAYDDLGRQTAGFTDAWYTTQTDLDSLGRPRRATDAMGNLRDLSYDPNGNLVAHNLVMTVNGVGQLRDSQGWSYDLSDRAERVVDAAGNSTISEFDGMGNLVRRIGPDGYWVAIDYDPLNRPVRAYDEKGHSVSTDLDLLGRTRSVTDPAGNKTVYEYYDALRDGRLRQLTDPVGRHTVFDYDPNGNRISVVDNLGQVSLAFYDALNRPVRNVGPVTLDRNPESPTFNLQVRPVTRNIYDSLGRLVEVKAGQTADLSGAEGQDVLATQMSYVYDDFGRRIRETDAAGRSWTVKYDIHGNPVEVTDARGRKTTQTFIYGGRPETRVAADGRRDSWVYNPLGQVVVAQSPEVSYSHTFDEAHRLASVTDSRGNKTISHRYSPGGRLLRTTLDDVGEFDYRYDSVGRLITIWDPFDTIVGYTYDHAGRLAQRWFATGHATDFAWNADGTLAQVKHTRLPPTGGALALIAQHDYLYDQLARRRQSTDRVGPVTQPASTEAFAFDLFQNRSQRVVGGVEQRYSYGPAQQLAAVRELPANNVVTALVYDLNGNLIRKCSGAGTVGNSEDCTGSLVTSLAYDASNRLAQAQVGGITETYGYDDQGRRVRKTVNGKSTFYLYNGPDVVAEYQDGWAAPRAVTLHGPGTDQPLARYSSDGSGGYQRHYYHADGLGSLVAVTDDQGTVAAAQMFDAWGKRIAESSVGQVPGYGYTGREPDSTGLIYYRARYYDPGLGRFTQRDPIGLGGGLNAYAYVSNSPVNFVDPAGTLQTGPTPNGAWGFGGYLQAPVGGGTRGTGSQSMPTMVDVEPVADGLGFDPADGPVLLAGGGVRSRASGGGSPIQEINQAAINLRYGQTLRQIQTIDPSFPAPSSIGPRNSGRSEGEVRYLEGVLRGMEQYPNKVGRTEEHHTTPKYLGGPASGPKVPIPAPYHQLITNEFRAQHGYGQPAPGATRLQEILDQVYGKYPLPPSP